MAGRQAEQTGVLLVVRILALRPRPLTDFGKGGDVGSVFWKDTSVSDVEGELDRTETG